MEVAALVLAALLAVACVIFAARPLLAERQEDAVAGAAEATELERVALLERRDRALAALKELEFDHRTGKLSDDDYRELVAPLRLEAADALAALDRRARPVDAAERSPQADVRA